MNHQNDRQSTVLYNTTKNPVPSCTPLDAGQCNKNDPYGGCYQPPNDGCTRLADGSITCPDNMPPPDIKNTCGGQSYCNRPPDGCGTGYVSGSFNGQAVCVKSSGSQGGGGQGSGSGTGSGSGSGLGSGSGSGSGSGDGSGTGVNTGTGNTTINNSSSSSSTTNTTINNSDGSSAGSSTSKTDFKIDFQPVVQAISALSDKLTWVKSELVTAVSRVEDKLTQTNSKLDSVKSSVDQTTQAVNANGDKVKSAVDANTAATNSVKGAVDANTNSTASKLNDVVNAINNKGSGGGGGSTDMKPTNDILTSIKEFLTGKADTSSLKADLPSEEVSSQTLDSGSFQSNPQCPPDVALALPGLGSYVFSYSRFCDALQIAGYFIMIAAYFFAALIVSKA
ncbi:virulence factor TspB C-terminal domain-related protein [Acinetobacter nosocomialis]|uniref:virulence factor TspB C-terminal domain-related protein n=1 Tax=Acinetobacter nosocomialis TaxID=106654 RepID=UPI00148F3B9A|nr:virulence factor TspB C-terminal domain-related protein [Acinetobacter nosocomialis]